MATKLHCCDFTEIFNGEYCCPEAIAIPVLLSCSHIMMSSNGNIFCITGPLWEESTGHRWIPLTKASDAELWFFLSVLIKQLSKHSRRHWLRRHCIHYDVTVMKSLKVIWRSCHRRFHLFCLTYELLNLRALKFSLVNKIHIFQCMGKIFSVEFQRYPLKFHTKYLTHTLKDTISLRRKVLYRDLNCTEV